MDIEFAFEKQVIKTLSDLGIPIVLITRKNRPIYSECENPISIGVDMFGREQYLERRTAYQWQKMRENAGADGVLLEAVSGFRSFDYQRKLIERKLAAGLSVDEIICVSAPPGYSEHHTGRALDISTPECPPVTEEFELTSAFLWLRQRGKDFGFQMTYPKDNQFGVI